MIPAQSRQALNAKPSGWFGKLNESDKVVSSAVKSHVIVCSLRSLGRPYRVREELPGLVVLLSRQSKLSLELADGLFRLASAWHITDSVVSGRRVPEEQLVGIRIAENVFGESSNNVVIAIDRLESNYVVDGDRRCI